jgi:hypothetical protein
MKHSNEINELAKAMSKLQSEIRDAEKDVQGYGYKYADLGQVLGLIRPLLEKNGLSFNQHVGNAQDTAIIETMVMHESGQWMSSEICMPVTIEAKRSAAQCVGIAITYGRRYALTAIFGITQVAEDQDGHAEKPVHQTRAYIPKETPKPAESAFITKDQEFELSKMMFEAKADSKAFNKSYGVETFSQLTQEQYKDAVKKLNIKMGKKTPSPLDYASV